jgi:hypothetical protein
MDISKNQWRSTGLNFESFLKTTIHAIHHVISKMYVYYIAVLVMKFSARKIKLN